MASGAHFQGDTTNVVRLFFSDNDGKWLLEGHEAELNIPPPIASSRPSTVHLARLRRSSIPPPSIIPSLSAQIASSGGLTLRLRTFCQLVNDHGVLASARIVEIECYKETHRVALRTSLVRRFAVGRLTRTGMGDVWMRVEREGSMTNPEQPERDLANFAPKKSLLADGMNKNIKLESRIQLPAPVRLAGFERIYTAIQGENLLNSDLKPDSERFPLFLCHYLAEAGRADLVDVSRTLKLAPESDGKMLGVIFCIPELPPSIHRLVGSLDLGNDKSTEARCKEFLTRIRQYDILYIRLDQKAALARALSDFLSTFTLNQMAQPPAYKLAIRMVDLYRQLYQSDPATYSTLFIHALDNLRGRTSLDEFEQVETCRELSRIEPYSSQRTVDLVTALSNYARWLTTAQRLPASERAYDMALNTAREAYSARTHAQTAVLGRTLVQVLRQHSFRLLESKRPEEACALAFEAVTTQRKIHSSSSDLPMTELVPVLSQYSLMLVNVNRFSESCSTALEGVQIARDGYAAIPTRGASTLLTALDAYEKRLVEAGRYPDAMKISREKVDVSRASYLRTKRASHVELIHHLRHHSERLASTGNVKLAKRLAVVVQRLQDRHKYRTRLMKVPSLWEEAFAGSKTTDAASDDDGASVDESDDSFGGGSYGGGGGSGGGGGGGGGSQGS